MIVAPCVDSDKRELREAEQRFLPGNTCRWTLSSICWCPEYLEMGLAQYMQHCAAWHMLQSTQQHHPPHPLRANHSGMQQLCHFLVLVN